MPQVKTHNFWMKNNAGIRKKFPVKMSVDVDGQFYCAFPDFLKDSIQNFIGADSKAFLTIKRRKEYLAATELDYLIDTIDSALKVYSECSVLVEHLIRYNIETHISFAIDKKGNIYPNSGYVEDAVWDDDNDKRYGRHYSHQPCRGGYSMTIGAAAMTKTTHTFGDVSKSEYEFYYKDDGDHLGNDNPAEILNSWTCIGLGDDDCKEIPYSDDAALFFHNLLLSMAKMAKMIQDNTFDEKDLLSLIDKGSLNLLGSRINE